jgi:hypothetical protein
MLVPAQRSWVVGEIVTAAYLNANIRDAVNYCLAPPMCDVNSSVTQSLLTGVVTALTFDTEVYDNDGAHSTVTNTSRITFQTAGWYHYEGVYVAAANATGYRGAFALKNGTVYKAGTRYPAPAVNTGVATVSGYMNVSAGDYLEIAGIQTAGTLSTDVSANGRCCCTTYWVSA